MALPKRSTARDNKNSLLQSFNRQPHNHHEHGLDMDIATQYRVWDEHAGNQYLLSHQFAHHH
jgi:hypothetical protein